MNQNSQSTTSSANGFQFVDRRVSGAQRQSTGFERRQFSNSYGELTPDARELAEAIDGYKLEHRRRFINFEEMLSIIKSLGYHKD
ncbi:MAG: hypothetical protein R3C03_06490 [Pirellulaceae bacterium]